MAPKGEDATEKRKKPTRRERYDAARARRGAHTYLWYISRGILTTAGSIVLVAGAFAFMLVGTPLDAPGWMKDRLTAGLERNMDGMGIGFGEISFTLGRDGRPSLHLGDVTLTEPDGRDLVLIDNAEMTLSMHALLDGQIQPKTVTITGVEGFLERDRTGRVVLSFIDGAHPVQAENVPELIGMVDEALQAPLFSELNRIDVRTLSLDFEDHRARRTYELEGGYLTVLRGARDLEATGGFNVLGGHAPRSTVEFSLDSDIGDKAAQVSFKLDDVDARDLAGQTVALAWLDALRAPISGAMRGSLTETGALGPVSGTLHIGEGVLQPTDKTRPIPFRKAHSYFEFSPATRTLRFDELAVDSDWGTGTATGVAYLDVHENGGLDELIGQFEFTGLVLNPADIYPAPLELSGASTDFRLELDPFRFTLGQLSVSQGETDLLLSGAVRAVAEGWNIALDAQVNEITVERAISFWPLPVASEGRAWAAENIRGGLMTGIDASLRWAPNEAPALHADFDFEKASVRYHATLPPLLDAVGHGTLDGRLAELSQAVVPVTVQVAANDESAGLDALDRGGAAPGGVSQAALVPPWTPQGGTAPTLTLKAKPDVPGLRLSATVTSGRILPRQGGALDVAGSSFTIPDTGVKNGPGEAELRVSAEVTSLLSMLNEPPFGIMDIADLPVDFAQGNALAIGRIVLPMQDQVQYEEIDFDVSARITGFETDELIPDQRLTAAALDLVADPALVSATGDVRVGDLPASVTWRQPIGTEPGPGSVTGTAEISQLTVDTFDIGLPDGTVSGQGTADFTLDMPKGAPPVLTAQSDLAGVRLAVPALGWSKPAASRGQMDVAVTLDTVPRVDSVSVAAAGLTATGDVTLGADGNLDRARATSLKIGNWLDVSAEMRGRGTAAPDIAVTGGRFDIRGSTVPEDSGAGGDSSVNRMTVQLDRLQVTETVALTAFAGDFDMRQGMAGGFNGRVNGGTPIAGQISPQDGGSAYRITSDDAGGVVRSAGVFDQGRDGDMVMTLLPADAPGTYNGSLRVENARVSGAPAVAAILNAISLVGLFSELAGKGIEFTGIDADFRLSPETLTIYRSSAVGPSIGMSMDGTYNLVTGWLDTRGVISPIYMFNVIGSVVTGKGEGLFGFNYTLKGPAEDPRVEVNLLSGLMPSFTRNIFRDAPRPKPPADGGEPLVEQHKAPQEVFIKGGDR
ncbi:AsmA-like C-terminal region-containing protein [Chachezhania antarctica]|uniref:AsmA-like C-terminal region-containing protein n=1 Tax=Chachezhania antarctica TaxID=2340860 RepID=UPI000EB19DD2|nr:AsmA-like C-terminal region-containing protein [Chachezhania antarctica]